MAPIKNKTLIFKEIPAGLPIEDKTLVWTEKDFDVDTVEIPEGGALVKNLYISLDPYVSIPHLGFILKSNDYRCVAVCAMSRSSRTPPPTPSTSP